MATAALLKAAKLIIASSKKPAKKTAAKKNPAPRKGTKKPLRASQITKKAPTKRLVKRRKANTEEGYFPNPVEVINAHGNPTPFHVYTVKMGKGPLTGKPIAKPVKCLASFATRKDADDFAKKQHSAVGVFKD